MRRSASAILNAGRRFDLEHAERFVERWRRPPMNGHAIRTKALSEVATAAVDVSDGLPARPATTCASASGVAARVVRSDALPLADGLRTDVRSARVEDRARARPRRWRGLRAALHGSLHATEADRFRHQDRGHRRKWCRRVEVGRRRMCSPSRELADHSAFVTSRRAKRRGARPSNSAAPRASSAKHVVQGRCLIDCRSRNSGPHRSGDR